MKIVLNLKKTINNYDWENKKELRDYIENNIKDVLYDLYNTYTIENKKRKYDDDDYQDRLYDILDMFSNYEIKE